MKISRKNILSAWSVLCLAIIASCVDSKTRKKQEYSVHLTTLSSRIGQTHLNITIDKFTEKTWTLKASLSSHGRLKKSVESDEQVLSGSEVETLCEHIEKFNLDSLSKVELTPGIDGTSYLVGIRMKGANSYNLRFHNAREKYSDQNKLVLNVVELAKAKIQNKEIQKYLRIL